MPGLANVLFFALLPGPSTHDCPIVDDQHLHWASQL